ncbi:MAG: response regulator [Duganella sp.]
MPDQPRKMLNMLLVEEQPLLRKTVSMTARSLGMGTVHEAATAEAAEKLLRERSFQGAVISLECGAFGGAEHNFTLLDRVRGGMSASAATIPIAVMVDRPTTELLQELRNREISRVIVKPFRAKVLLDTFASFA